MEMMTKIIKNIDSWVWGLPLILLILLCGIWLTFRIRGLQIRRIGLALKFMVTNEEEGEGEVTSFGALCTALSATIGTGNIVGVATAIAAGGPGALFWMEIAALFGMATKYAEGFLAIKYRTVDKEGHYLGGPFYYIEMVWAPAGSGWQSCSHCSVCWLVCWASVPLRRSTASPLRQTISLMLTASTLLSPCSTQATHGRQSSWAC